MSAERLLEERALRISELAGELVAARLRGEEPGERLAMLVELRRQAEALDAQASMIHVKLAKEIS